MSDNRTKTETSDEIQQATQAPDGLTVTTLSGGDVKMTVLTPGHTIRFRLDDGTITNAPYIRKVIFHLENGMFVELRDLPNTEEPMVVPLNDPRLVDVYEGNARVLPPRVDTVPMLGRDVSAPFWNQRKDDLYNGKVVAISFGVGHSVDSSAKVTVEREGDGKEQTFFLRNIETPVAFRPRTDEYVFEGIEDLKYHIKRWREIFDRQTATKRRQERKMREDAAKRFPFSDRKRKRD